MRLFLIGYAIGIPTGFIIGYLIRDVVINRIYKRKNILDGSKPIPNDSE
jgi:hypothetical protein